jgi:hypothetical protein
LNNSGNDPSGAGNSAKVPDAPTNNTVGTANSSASPTKSSSTRNDSAANDNSGATGLARSNDVPAGDGNLRQNGTRMSGNGQPTTTTETNSDAQIDTENRKLEGKVKSICRGC